MFKYAISGSSGHALLILRPEELGFLWYLKQAKVPLNEFEFSWSKIADIQLQVILLENNLNLAGVILTYWILKLYFFFLSWKT